MTQSPQTPRDETDILPGILLPGILETLPNGIALFDENGSLVGCNARYREMLAPVSDLIRPGLTWRRLIQECARRGVFASGEGREAEIVERTAADLAERRQNACIEHADGRFYTLSYTDADDDGFAVVQTDVTEQRRKEARLRQQEALLHGILDSTAAPLVIARVADGAILYRSPAAQQMLGRADAPSNGPFDAEDWQACRAALEASGQVQALRTRTMAQDGRPRVLSLSGGMADYDGARCAVLSLSDPAELLESDARIRLVFEACPAPLLMIHAGTGDILFRSPQAIALFGDKMRAGEFYVTAKDREGFLDNLRKQGEVADYRLRLRNAAGVPCWCAVSARLIRWDGQDVIVSHSRDLTHQLSVDAELERQRDLLFQNEKMSALGDLLAGVAHELNNPLSIVVGHAMILADGARDPYVLRQAAKIGSAAERCAQIVKTFLTMSAQQPLRLAPTDIAAVVETAADVARYGNPGRLVRLDTDLRGDLPDVCADIDQITQALVHLILNAHQAIESSGTGDTVRVSAQGDRQGDTVKIIVEDNGPGIPADIRARVFEPFFTTKGVGKGTGIGLAVCHRVVQLHGGTISIDEIRPHGTRFTISLPGATKGTDCTRDPETMPDSSTALRVLVIDDETDVADLNVEVLQTGGYRAEAAYRADTALEMLRSRPYDVVLSDLNMPGIDGRGLFERISGEFPHLTARIGFVTGDTMGRASQRFLSESKRPYIEKPVSPKELRSFVAQLSAEGTPP